jgi:hypothetical protein
MRTVTPTISVLVLLEVLWAPLPAQQAAPTNLQASASGPTAVSLTWSGAAGANGYVVQRSIGSTAFDRLTPTKITATNYTDAAAPAGSALRYRIRAVFANGQSSLSAIASVTTPSGPANTASGSQPAGPPPGQPTTEPAVATTSPGARAIVRAAPVPLQTYTPSPEPRPVLRAAPSPSHSPAPASKDPTGFTATAQGNRVTLSWQPVPGVAWYLLGGPGIGLHGQQVQGTSYTVGPLDPGGYEWSVASLEGEGLGALTNGAFWPKARAVISNNTAGAYRISVAGFRVNHNTHDDQLNRDGWGDEIFSSVVLQRFDRATGRLIEGNSVTSSIHGDGNQAPERVPQGSASGNGGLSAGDVVPFGWDERTPQPSLIPGRFPLRIWEGPLADGGDVLVLRPTLWEADGDRTAFDWWLRFLASSPATDTTWKLPGLQQSLKNTAIDIIPGIGRSLYPNDTHLLYASPDIVDQLAVGNSQPNYINPGRHRPVGLQQHYWKDQLLVLSREKIEAELNRASQVAAPAGLIVVPLEEEQGGTTPLGGKYLLYLRVERK